MTVPWVAGGIVILGVRTFLESEPSRDVSCGAVRDFRHNIPSANRPPIQAATHVRVTVTASKVTDVRGLMGLLLLFLRALLSVSAFISFSSPDWSFWFRVRLHLVWSASRHARDSISMSNALMSLLQTFTNLRWGRSVIHFPAASSPQKKALEDTTNHAVNVAKPNQTWVGCTCLGGQDIGVTHFVSPRYGRDSWMLLRWKVLIPEAVC